MQRSIGRAALAAAILSAALGCTRTMVQQSKQPPDPLLISKKPVEGKRTSGPSARELARVDPRPPVLSTEDGTYTAGGRGVPAQLSSELVVRPGE